MSNSCEFVLFTFPFVFCNFPRPPPLAVSWDSFAAYMHSANYQILPCCPDGFCFLNSIQLSLAINHKIFTTVEAIKSEIISFLAKNLNHYSNWHEGDILKETEAYFRTGQFAQSIVDLIIEVAPYALNVNLYIYQRGTDGNLSVKKYYQGVSKPDIHLHFQYNKDYELANHYQPIVKFANTNQSSSQGLFLPVKTAHVQLQVVALVCMICTMIQM